MTTLIMLFLGAFLAATIVPFSSEVMLLAALQAPDVSKPAVIATASLGNILGAVVNWALGHYLLHWVGRPWFPFKHETIEKASQRFNRYGVWSLLFSFLPVVGDPLTFVAGMLSVPLPLFLVLVSIGKTARYLFIGWAV